jgi:hypothetical protein
LCGWDHFHRHQESGVFFAYSCFIPGTITPLKYLSKTEVLAQGGITPRILIPYPLTYDDALTACAHMGEGQLPDPANMAAWRALLNTTALQMGERWTDPFDLWLPYRSPPGTLYRKSNLCIRRIGIARPQSQFLHSCVCERFPGSVHIFGYSKIDGPSWKCTNLSQIYECRNWEKEHHNSVLEITRLHSCISGKNGNQTFIVNSHRPFICVCRQ